MKLETRDAENNVYYTEIKYLDKDTYEMPLSEYMEYMRGILKTGGVSYRGVQLAKLPTDCWTYREMISFCRPNIIIEIGNFAGGSTMMLADYLFSLSTKPKCVIAIDIDRGPLHPVASDYPGIAWITGLSWNPKVLAEVGRFIEPGDKVMVIDDGDHVYEHTLMNLQAYSPLVTDDQYYVVEDTIFNSLLPHTNTDMQSFKAVDEFIAGTDDFIVDRLPEKFLLTTNPGGYLLRVPESMKQ